MPFCDELERNSGHIAFSEGDIELRYDTLVELADAITANMPTRSLSFIICQNSLEVPVGYVGMLRKRVVPIMINRALKHELYDELYEKYRPQYVWCPKGFKDGKVVATYREYVLVSTGEDAPQMDDNLALLLTTSGSTGSPKLVRQSYRNIDANTVSIAKYLNIQADDRAITSLPLSYTYGLSILQSHLFAGAQIILTEHTVLEKNFWQTFQRKAATTFGAVPYTYQMLDRLRFLEMDLPSLRYVTQAGGRLGEELHYKFASGLREQGRALIVMYGATEATARMSYVPKEVSVEKAGSIGIAIPGGRFELIDADDRVINAPDTVGELVYYGENVTLGYAEGRDDLCKGDERNGRLETGDMAKRDADGFYYVVGRKKRFLKLYGNRINLVEVEDLLLQEGYEAACVGEDDRMRIYTTSTETGALVAYIAEKTNINRTAFTAIHIPSIPRNGAGKVLYAELA